MKRYLKKSRFGWLSIAIALAVLVLAGILVAQQQSNNGNNQQPVEEILGGDATPAVSAEPLPEEAEEEPQNQWPVQLTAEQANSLTVVVNKKHKLPSSYVPSLKSVAGGQMRPEAADALQELLEAAEQAGVPMKIVSSYRSYANQQSTYNKWVAQDGQAAADTYSARPGHSEHQTGLAVDLGNGTCDLETCFGDTAAGKWLAAHAPEYGFIIRYEQNKDTVTGYQYEPWHLRYLGKQVAQSVAASGKTLEEYYGIPGGGY